ncbi:MAG: carbon monoxide dehydrogenase subunit G [Proteobacteria bacterium]|nr:carbon monoxide dehydrogenase subunit G [Pseudomonadota bacterium]MBU1452685.1 carbon monoxide dehydrogenase subunit G [Pseudomonadota bacterium]MBU2467208.1 carbon monoxide dehydrogenase subunit G [Pseudomonadota bacterium]MBU2518972.1 carbon monoxide dehydrogenase subunit G [Pseudomonadota bacterium]
MQLKGKYEFNGTQQQVWDLFTNPESLAQAMPGCQELRETGPGKYDALMKIGIAAVKGTYTGKFEIADPDPPNRYQLIGEGSGSPGFVKGTTDIQLTGSNDKTIVTYQGEVQVGGLIAGVGQRMISGIAKMMLNQFFKKMKKELKASGSAGS